MRTGALCYKCLRLATVVGSVQLAILGFVIKFIGKWLFMIIDFTMVQRRRGLDDTATTNSELQRRTR